MAFILHNPEEDLKFYTSYLDNTYNVQISESTLSRFLKSRDITLKIVLAYYPSWQGNANIKACKGGKGTRSSSA